MRSFIRFIMFILIASLIGFVYYGLPVFSASIGCYDQQMISFDEAEVRMRSEGSTDKKKCEMKQDALVAMDVCLNNAEQIRQMPLSLLSVIRSITELIRPGRQSLDALKIDFNQECADYPNLLFTQPDSLDPL